MYFHVFYFVAGCRASSPGRCAGRAAPAGPSSARWSSAGRCPLRIYNVKEGEKGTGHGGKKKRKDEEKEEKSKPKT